MAALACSSVATRSEGCRDSVAATHLKLVSISLVFITSVVGIGSPVILARIFNGKPVYDKAILLIKCFAAGVILSTSLVHVLPDAFSAMSDCQVASVRPWKDFPFAGFVVLVGALLALFVDLTATSHVHSSHRVYAPLEDREEASAEIGCKSVEMTTVEAGLTLGLGGVDDIEKMKQRLVSKVLEIGIIFHSVIIGMTMGMSQNQCTIRPLVAALSFHQIFEGMGLGGCIAQADFRLGTVMYMGLMFSATTPLGIVVGMVVFYVTGYDDSSQNALILEGMLGSLSSGILIYMALVDLVAVDFFHNKTMTSSPHLKMVSYISLVLGSSSMSLLALWA